MRRLMIVTTAAAVGLGLWYWLTPRKTNVPAAVGSTPAPLPELGQSQPQGGNPLTGGIDYLNFDWDSMLFPWGQPTKQPETPAPTYPIPGDNMIQPKGIRNNNPLNIEAGQPWNGATGNDGRFAIFETAWYGIRAAGRLLKTYRDRYGLNTVREIVNRWAPPSDNNPTDNYVSFVAKGAGVSAGQPLGAADYPRVVAAMIKFENGFNPYEQSLINSAVAAGME
ncbi:hypothetical protein ACRTDM_04690 [Shewanella algae]|uniref:hypothetical protein n=1 Tax=Shewanella algae TaxID=38313 RepID=UPI003D7D93F3